jgi:hypothetical protein
MGNWDDALRARRRVGMIAIAKNLGEAPLFYCDRLAPNDDGTVTAVMADGSHASQQPTAGQPYASAYGLFRFSTNNGEWERAELHGQILSYTVNNEKFGYVWF